MGKTFINHCFEIHEDGETGELFLMDSYGAILSIKETKEIIKGLQLLIDTTSEEEINAINNKIMKDKRESMFPKFEELEPFCNNANKPYMPTLGFIYFVQDDQGRVKIGKTRNIAKRMGEYSKLPAEPILIHVFESPDYDNAELYIHDYYKDKRLRGEWFALSAEDIEFIQNGELDIRFSK